MGGAMRNFSSNVGSDILVMGALGLVILRMNACRVHVLEAGVVFSTEDGSRSGTRDLFQLNKDTGQRLGVLGQQIRMDSKLIGSNIALCCRLQLVMGCLQGFWGSLGQGPKGTIIGNGFWTIFQVWKCHQAVYGLTSWFTGIRALLSRLQGPIPRKTAIYGLIVRVFEPIGYVRGATEIGSLPMMKRRPFAGKGRTRSKDTVSTSPRPVVRTASI